MLVLSGNNKDIRITNEDYNNREIRFRIEPQYRIIEYSKISWFERER